MRNTRRFFVLLSFLAGCGSNGGNNSCTDPLLACGSQCVDPQIDPNHCGACDKACDAGFDCVAGKCAVSCQQGLTVCGASCTNLQIDPAHCGKCETACAMGMACAKGACVKSSCAAPLLECNMACVDGRFDPDNCGMCGKACPMVMNGARSCNAGVCGMGDCSAGFLNCDGQAQNGCEQDGRADVANCGACANACPIPAHAMPSCAASACGLGKCDADFDDCDKDAKNGCEASLLTDPKNCSACGMACPMNLPYCSDGVCVNLYTFKGVANDLPIADLSGWMECFSNLYTDAGTPIADVLAKCAGKNLLLGCRAIGDKTLRVAAHAPREDVIFDTGGGDCDPKYNMTHEANGVAWYFNDSWSWGFALAGDKVDRCSCDVESDNPDQRICWHTQDTNFLDGYRCGGDTDYSLWERVVFTSP